MNDKKIISFYKETKKNNLILSEEYIDFLAEKYQTKEELPFIGMTFEEWVDFNVWKNSSKIKK